MSLNKDYVEDNESTYNEVGNTSTQPHIMFPMCLMFPLGDGPATLVQKKIREC